MGYYTHFDLDYNADIDEELIIKALQDINPYEFNYAFCEDSSLSLLFEEETKWYEHEEDMKELSLRFPDIIFDLYGEGEDRDDNWIKHFKNGMMQVRYGTIQYDPYDPTFFNNITKEGEK